MKLSKIFINILNTIMLHPSVISGACIVFIGIGGLLFSLNEFEYSIGYQSIFAIIGLIVGLILERKS